MRFRKSVHPVVSVALLLVVTVVAAVGFQTWYSSYSSDIISSIESRDSNQVRIESIVDSYIYLKGETGTDIENVTIRMEGNVCRENVSLVAGINKIDISSCLNGSVSSTYEIVVEMANTIISGSYYLDIPSKYLDSFYRFDFSSEGMPTGLNFSRNSVATYFTKSGIFANASENEPRFSYEYDTGSDSYTIEGLLVEPSVTNTLGTRSTNFSAWTMVNVDIETVSDPKFGTVTRMTDNATDAEHFIYWSPSLSTGNNYTRSFYVKKETAKYVIISRAIGLTTQSHIRTVDLDSGSFVGGSVGYSPSVDPVGGGWYRVSFDDEVLGASTRYISIWITNSTAQGGIGGSSYIGEGQSVLIHNAQTELGTDLTSVIQTSDTREADNLTLNIADGTYDIVIERVAGTQSLSNVVVSGGYQVPVNASPLISVELTKQD